MSITLYSSATTDSLLAAKLSDAPIDGTTYGRNNGAWSIVTGGGLTISDLSNSATSTLNAGVPTAGQALTYDGTDLIWATVGGGSYLPLTGGTVTGQITVDESATSGFTASYKGAGMYDPGNSMYVSFEEVQVFGLNITLPDNDGVGGFIASVGQITFADSTTQTTAAVSAAPSANLGDAFTLAKHKGSTNSMGYWVITFAPVTVESMQFGGGLQVSLSNGSSSESITSFSSSMDWTYTTTTLTSSDYIYFTFRGQRSSIEASSP